MRKFFKYIAVLVVVVQCDAVAAPRYGVRRPESHRQPKMYDYWCAGSQFATPLWPCTICMDIQEELADQMNFGVRCIDSAARSDFCVLRSNALHNGMKFQRVAIATPWKFIIIVSMFVFAEKFICTTEWIEVS